MSLKPLMGNVGITFGCDPEFFFSSSKGEIIGSEKIINRETGLQQEDRFGNNCSKFTVDGVQAELNPSPSGRTKTCSTTNSKCLKNFQFGLKNI